MAKVPWVFFGSERRKTKQELKRGKEPQPKYRTGKFWTD